MQVRVTGTANLSQAKAEFAALQAQVLGLNAAMAASSKIPQVDPSGYQRYAGAIEAGSKAYRNSLASTGAFRVEQVRLNSATEHYTELLQKQKMSFRDLKKNADIMKHAYGEQLAMQKMQVRQAGAMGGKNLWDTVTPRLFTRELDTAGNRAAWLGQQLKSGGTQMVNFGKNTQWAGRQLTVGFTMPMVAVGVAAGYMAYKIDKEMTRIKKVYDTTADQSIKTHEGMAAVAKEFADLEAAAWRTASTAAQEYGASATDTLGVQAELAATGEKGAKLQNATVEVMKSAMLGEIDYQTATTATIALQQQLHLSTQELTDSWAYMNSVENATSLQMKDFAQAIPIALGPIKQMGGSLQDLGTLMTSMISRGVQVGKAANAIKALPQRLLRPSKQIQEEWKMITGTDIVKIAEKNKGNIMGILQDIYKSTKNLNKLQQGKAFAGLFGSYQLTTMSAMIAGMGDLEKGIGQVTRAQEIGAQSAKDWAQVSKGEIEAYQESVSGQFKIMVENLKVEVAQMGEPFLKVASTVGKALTNIISVFNDLPKSLKVLIALPLVLAAIAGPALMLVGLFYNLVGQGYRATGSMLSFGKSMMFATAQERAMTLAHAKEQHALQSTAGKLQTQTFMLGLLTKAETEAERATMAFALAQQGVSPAKITAALGNQAVAQGAVTAAVQKTSQELWQQSLDYFEAARAAERYHAAQMKNPSALGVPMGTHAGEASKKAQMGWDAMLASAYAENDERKAGMVGSTAAVADNTKEISKGMALAGVATAATAASMVTMMVSSNETVNDIAQWVMMAGILAPAMSMMTPVFSGIGARAKEISAETAKTHKGMGGAWKNAKAFGSAMVAAMGPVGWITAAVVAIGGAMYLAYKMDQKRLKSLKDQSKAVGTQKNLMADMLKIQPQAMKQMRVPMGTDVAGQPGAMDIADAMEKSKTAKPLLDTIKAASETERATIAAQKYAQVLQATGGNATKAKRYVEAMFMAAGESAEYATKMASDAFARLGKQISADESARLWVERSRMAIDTEVKKGFWGTVLPKAFGGGESTPIIEAGKQIGAELSNAVAAGTMTNREAMMSAQKVLAAQWTQIWSETGDDQRDDLAKLGVTSAREFQMAMTATMRSENPIEEIAAELGVSTKVAERIFNELNGTAGEYSDKLGDALTLEESMVSILASHLRAGKNILTLQQLSNTEQGILATATKNNAKQVYQQLINQQAATGGLVGFLKSLNVQERIRIANTVRAVSGLQEIKTVQQLIAWEAGKTEDNIFGAAGAAGALKGQLSGIDRLISISVRFNKEDVSKVKRAGMEGAQNDIADAMSQGFDERMNASLDASQRGWDNRMAANDAAAERASEKMNNKWERINNQFERKWDRRKDAMEAYYDRRVKAIDKAIEREEKAEETRQRIFEAEKTRMERLTDMANKNIDFNMAINTGNLDEAAKIRNDVAAQQADWALSDASDAGSRASQGRVDRLNQRKDRVEDNKDAALKQLEKNEKAAKASLERREKREKAHLERMTKMRADNLRRQADADMAASRARWDREKRSFDQRITLFKSYIARDQKDLERWMKKVGISYDGFGRNVKQKGETWSQWFQNSMVRHMRVAGNEIKSDKMWQQMGEETKNRVLRGMGFKNMAEFRKFIKDGTLPANYGSRDLPKVGGGGASGKAGGTGKNYSAGNDPKVATAHHTGGMIGEGGGSRKGVARTLAGQHHSEVMVNAQKGEFMVNRKAAAENRPILEAINSGRRLPTDSPRNTGKGVGGPGTGFGAVLAGGMAKMFAAGIGAGMKEAFRDKKAAIAAAATGGYGVGAVGVYGGRAFNAEQLGNAATIANVGANMGMSARDIMIGIMTAIAESGLINVKYGDRDSQGLFQQRPSQGWGTVEQVTDPQYAARAFFNALKGVTSRNDMRPWMAAQTVQRSAFSDGSNYAVYWDDANGIFKKGLSRNKNGNFTPTAGAGGKHKPSVPGKGWRNSHDYGNGLGSPIYAFEDGRIISSKATTSGGSPGNGKYRDPITGKGYTSYGEVIKFRGKSGNVITAAHLSPGQRAPVGPYKGGALIGRSGSTGNSTGPHTHFEWNGSENAASAFRAYGIGLNTGGYLTRDGMANLHKDEVVVDPNRTDSLFKGIDKFSSVMDSVKNVGYGTGGEPLANTAASEGISKLFGVGLASAPRSAGKAATTGTGKPGGGTNSGGGAIGNTGNGKPGTVRSGSFNVHAYGHSPARSIADLKKVLQHVDSIALQEFTNGTVWKWLANAGWGVKKGPTGTAVAWRKSKYQALKTTEYDLNKKYRMPKRTSQRYAVSAKLKDKKTGAKFWQSSVHLIPGTNYFRGAVSNAHRVAILNEQYQRLRKHIDNLDNSAPVVLGGDFNERRHDRMKGLMNKGRGANIDFVYSQLKAIGGMGQISKKQLASDHPAVWGHYKLPGLKTGGYTMGDGMAMLHKKELVVDAARTKILHEGIENLASGNTNAYNDVKMYFTGDVTDKPAMRRFILDTLDQAQGRRPQSRRG